jgi:hypothetical protein|tara:strand:+ start:3383 stop:3583 length:201 start_codon:yes stop_codon:yes gene_type:complete
MLELLGEVGEEGKSRGMEILVAAGVEADGLSIARPCARARRLVTLTLRRQAVEAHAREPPGPSTAT